MYAQRSSIGRGREHADYATLRQNLGARECDCRDGAFAAPVASAPPMRPNDPTCLESYPLAMVYAPTQAFESL